MKLHVLVVAVTACGGGKAPATTPANAPAVYAPMFVKGASWTFSAETKTTPPVDMGPPTTEAKPEIVCTVTDVHEMAPATMATVGCTAGTDASPTGNEPPAGLYVKTATGMWWFDASIPDIHAKASSPDPKELLIPAVAAERKQEGKSGDIESWVYETKREKDAWCGYYSSAAGDEGGWGICFDATGPVRANRFQAGATTVETTYKRK